MLMKKTSLSKWILGVLWLLLSLNSYARNFIAFSDIHFDPFTTCKLELKPCPIIGKLQAASPANWAAILQAEDSQNLAFYKSDTNYALLTSALNNIQLESKKSSPEFIVILGDFLAHDYQERYKLYSRNFSQQAYQDFVKKTFEFLTLQIQQRFPQIPVYPLLGNNDSYTGNYKVAPQGAFVNDLAKIWEPLINDSNKEFNREFTQAGYYAITPPAAPQLKLIFLNSNLFSQNNTINDAVKNQLQWLNLQLANATQQQQKVLIFMHIPVGIDVYKTIKNPVSSTITYWQASTAKNFLAILNQHAAIISGVISSHIHMDGFALLGTQQIPNSFVPAISPIYGNNAAFKIYSLGPTNTLQNFKTYYLNLTNASLTSPWALEYDFNATYAPNCSECDLRYGMQQFDKNKLLMLVYRNYYTVNHENSQPISDEKWLSYYQCTVNNATSESYNACLSHVVAQTSN